MIGHSYEVVRQDFSQLETPPGTARGSGSGLIYLESGCPLGNELEAEFARNAQGLSTKEVLDARNKHMSQDDRFLSQYVESSLECKLAAR